MAIILIVDDHPTTREFLVPLLGYQGHRLLEATGGAAATGGAHSGRPNPLSLQRDILPPEDEL